MSKTHKITVVTKKGHCLYEQHQGSKRHAVILKEFDEVITSFTIVFCIRETVLYITFSFE
jgi:hypothetical protein